MKITKTLVHDDSNAWLYIYRQDGTPVGGGKHVLLSYDDRSVFKGTYNECVDYFNANESEILHPNHPRLIN